MKDKISKAIKRCYVGSYFISLLGGCMAGLLFLKSSMVALIIFEVIAIAGFAAIIVSRCWYRSPKWKQYYIYIAIASFAVMDILVLSSFVTEIVYTSMGKSATYAWIINVGSILGLIPINYFVIKDFIRIINEIIEKNKKIVEAEIKEE